MSTLVKTTIVLDLTFQGKSVVEFSSFYEDWGGVDKLFRLQRDDWLDLGRPDTITITVEPGDQLNS